jgi:putative hydrolase of the HAD superfamily
MRYEAVIFDFGGVFTPSPLVLFEAYENARGLPARFIGEVIKRNHLDNAWAQYERGQIGITEFDELFARESGACGHLVSGRDVVELLSFSIRPDMVAALQRVKDKGLRTGCITNTLPHIEWSAMMRALDDANDAEALFSEFDVVLESSKIGLRKPDPAIYRLMCEQLDVAPMRCIFLDDLGINLKPAREMGMTTVKVPVNDPSPAIDIMERLLETD